VNVCVDNDDEKLPPTERMRDGFSACREKGEEDPEHVKIG
jgi:hypothetical protein